MSQAETIKDSAFIYVILKRLFQSHTLLLATVEGVPGQFNTAILDIDEESNSLIIDELNHPRGHAGILRERRLKLSGGQRGVKVEMIVEVADIDTADEISRYVVKFPDSVVYFQKRQNYRVMVSADMTFPLNVTIDRNRYNGNISDISENGLGAVFPERIEIARGDKIRNCSLQLPNGGTLLCNVQVCHIDYNDRHNLTHIGCKILDLHGTQQKSYLRAMQFVQREMIRRQSRVN